MRALYLSDPVRNHLGPCLRPGGDVLTRRMLELLAPSPNSMILDGGCGGGATLELLRERGHGRAWGCDLHPLLLAEASAKHLPVFRADLQRLPLGDASLDLVLCECVWNLTDRPQVAGEIFRVLKPGCYWAITDISVRGEICDQWPISCCFAGASDLGQVRATLEERGFAVELFEDHSPLLTRTAAEFVFAHGSLAGFWEAVLGDPVQAAAACAAAAISRPGLFLLLARRSRHERL